MSTEARSWSYCARAIVLLNEKRALHVVHHLDVEVERRQEVVIARVAAITGVVGGSRDR